MITINKGVRNIQLVERLCLIDNEREEHANTMEMNDREDRLGIVNAIRLGEARIN